MILRGEGRPGELGGPSGDLIVVILVEPHPFFQRSGFDIILEYPISFIDAILGAKVEIPTINGKETINIKPGSEAGEIITLRNKGAPHPNSSQKGDMHIGLKVKLPKKLKKPIKQTLERLKQSIDEDYIFQDNKELKNFLFSRK
jgi:molecular chaperone DnaJ